MKKLWMLVLCIAALSHAAVAAEKKTAAAASQGGVHIGVVNVAVDASLVCVRVTGNTQELQSLATQAFSAHGRYTLRGTPQYTIAFTQTAPTQVKVEITRNPSGTVVHSQVVAGASARQALLKAADVAVVKTNGLGLKGFFASRLAFIGERTGRKEVYVSDLFAGDMKQITRDNAHALTPRWAPDGSRIVYTSFYKSGFPDVFQIDLGTYQRTSLVSFKGTNQGARFSPNGRQLALVLSGEGNPEVYVADAAGRGVRRLTRTVDAVEASPCFSPDGSRLVFTSDSAGGPQLYVMSASGGTMSRLPTAISGYCAEPDWSQGNPNRIAFTMRIGRGYQIAVFDMTARQSKQVSKASFDAVEPSWLADGRHLVYTARGPSESVLCILDTETGRSMPITARAFGPALQASVLAPTAP